MTNINWNPDTKQLKQFGIVALFGFAVVGAVIGWKFGHFESGSWTVPSIIWGVGVLSALLSISFPKGLLPIYWTLSGISAVVGPIVSTLALLTIFIVIFTPFGLFFRLVKRDALRRKIDRENAETYWITPAATPEPGSYFRQF